MKITFYNQHRWLKILLISICTIFFSFSLISADDQINIIESKKNYEQGVNLLNKGNIIGAITAIEKAVELFPDNQFAHFKLGVIFLEKTKAKFYSKAPDHFKKVIEIVKDATDSYYIDSYYYLAISYLQLGQYDEAIAAFKEVIALDSNYAEAIKIHNYLGVAYYYKDNYEQAIPQFKSALQMDSHYKISNFNLKSVNMRLEHYNIGITYFFMKNYDEAIKEFSIAVEIDSNYFAAHMMLGECYLKKGIYTEAVRELKRAMMINPTHRDIPKILNKLGIVFYLQEKYEEAIFNLRKALELDPDNTEAVTNLRNVYRNFAETIKVRIEKIDRNKNKDAYVKAHLDLADDYFLIEMFEDALKEYQKAFEADSQNEALYKKLKVT
ncbi:MAG: tetratricopeptide repeat protein, partial [Candidatus Firestonebacteria bacterium]|nr:tetratricopeptide repeat protein [Candidatus Firestonebacteria bacterium]